MTNQLLTVQSSNGEYQVVFVEQADGLIDLLKEYDKSVAIIDKNVALLYPQLVVQLENRMPLLLLEALEESKTLAGAERVLDFLQQQNANKSTTVIAIGGGITQDITSFAAHIFYRGLRFVYVPTTLLAMGDSCIGAKCGLNFNGYKNQIGAFHPPQKVIIWDGFLPTLSDADIYSGYGELLKLSLIGDPQQFNSLKTVLSECGFRNSQITQHIYEGLLVKKKFIEEDEFDVGSRRLLNYGHTFGHALELATNYRLAHGIAVVLGIDIANFIAYHQGLLDLECFNDIHQFIAINFDLGVLRTVTSDALIANAKKDKKVTGDKINMALLTQPGFLVLHAVSFDSGLKEILNAYLERIVKQENANVA